MKRWRKEPNETGLMRVCQSTRGFELRENGVTIAHVATKFSDTRWYWYGFGKNTSATPVATAEEAKKEVMKYIKDNGL